MNPSETPPLLTPARRRHSVFLKLASIGGLILLLQIPLILTQGVLSERQGYQRQAVAEIAGLWGREQTVTGPVLAVPYAYKTQVIRPRVVAGKAVQVEETEFATATAYFLPETLTVGGSVETEVRHRGIYDAAVYGTKLRFAGCFQPDFATAGVEADRIDWDKACVLFGVSDLRGVRSVSPLQITGGKMAAFESADGAIGKFLPLVARIEGAAPGVRMEFVFEAALQGSERLQIAPVGKVTTVALDSVWPDPSFCGAYLPVKRQVAPDGFKAEWEVSHFSRGFPQSWTTQMSQNEEMARKITAAGFGVAFAQPVDGYRLAERAEKYGLLFFTLVFAVFFLFEMTAGLRIHPLQYVLVGAGLCLFFVAFLALSEFLATGLAYGVAAAACTALVSLYAWSFLHTGWRTLDDPRWIVGNVRLSLFCAAVAGLRAARRNGGALRRPGAGDVRHAAHQLVFTRNGCPVIYHVSAAFRRAYQITLRPRTPVRACIFSSMVSSGNWCSTAVATMCRSHGSRCGLPATVQSRNAARIAISRVTGSMTICPVARASHSAGGSGVMITPAAKWRASSVNVTSEMARSPGPADRDKLAGFDRQSRVAMRSPVDNVGVEEVLHCLSISQSSSSKAGLAGS